MSESINRWFSRTARLPGLSGCGLRYPDGTVYSRSWEPHLSEALLNEIWERLLPIAAVAAEGTPESLRWTFDKSLVLAATRPAGPTFFALFTRKPDQPDAPGFDRLLHEFRALRD